MTTIPNSPKSAAERIREVTAVAASPGNAHADHYMRGMANGLILANAINEDREPVYIEADKVFDYMTEADKTCSVVFAPEHLHAERFVDLMNMVASIGEIANLTKKLLFRGKTPVDVGYPMPDREDSLAPFLQDASQSEVNIIHGIIGVITEAAEMAEILRDRIYVGKAFDKTHLLEESGDVEWYQARILRGIGASPDMRDKANINKLRGRHGSSFDVFRDANRNLEAERVKLEQDAAPLFEKIEDAIMPELSKVPPRVRNNPPLPPGVDMPTGSDGIDNENIEHHARKPIGDCEGLDC